MPSVGRVATAKAKADKASLGEKLKRRRLLTEVREEAKEFTDGLTRNMDPAEAVQRVLDNVMSMYDYATQQVFTLAEDEYFRESLGGPVVHEWIREQERLGLQVVHVAAKASAMGLAERQVRVQEAQAALFAIVVEQVLQELGLGNEDRHRAHTLIAAKLEDPAVLEGTARAIPAEAAA